MSNATLQKLKQEIKLELFQEFILPMMQEKTSSHSKKHASELGAALHAIHEGDTAYQNGTTRPFHVFMKSVLPRYAKNK